MNAYKKIIVDEAQDMNLAQLLLAQLLLAPDGEMVIVGDSRQAIYGFRGADSGALDRMGKELNARRLPLNITYRCPKAVVAIANLYVSNFFAADTAPEGEVHEFTTVQQALELAGPGDFVLCRANAPLMSVCLKLIASGKRAFMAGRDVGEKLLQVLKGAKGKMAFLDIPDMLERLEAWSERELAKIERVCKRPADREAKSEQIQDILGIFQALAENVESPEDVEGELRRLFQEPGIKTSDFVMCSTVHRAKGLEADNVFILQQGFNREGAEEDNIRYVAVTRAKKRLYAVGFSFQGNPRPEGEEASDEEGETASNNPLPNNQANNSNNQAAITSGELSPVEVLGADGALLGTLYLEHLQDGAWRLTGHGASAVLDDIAGIHNLVRMWFPGFARLTWEGCELLETQPATV